ncbi:MAG TPA: helicase-related protein, partial [Caldilineaceae bacterium]|nr:helicase-related protein [Caldilineaceae bacterium]
MLYLCRQQQSHRRKVLLFLRQTGTRNIQPRLHQLLTGAGLRTAILPDSLEPAKREAWIDQRVADHAVGAKRHLDVLIVNPRKVETGLDLIKFATILFFEPEYSLTTVWQAMKRVYRLGQTQPVEIYFLVYQNTLESHALNLVGQKMSAALLLYGDNAASAIADESDGDGDLLAELTTKILQGHDL